MATGLPKPRPPGTQGGAGAAGGLSPSPEDPDRADDTVAHQRDSSRPVPISRITARRDFLAANTGVRVPATAFILLVKPTTLGETRAGFTVSKKVGNAVARNRARRRLREATRIAMPESAVPGADHVFIARRMDAERPFEDLLRDTRHALAKAGRKLAGNG